MQRIMKSIRVNQGLGGQFLSDEQKARMERPLTWLALRERPKTDPLHETLQGLIGNAANLRSMELVKDLLSKAAAATIREITSSAARAERTARVDTLGR